MAFLTRAVWRVLALGLFLWAMTTPTIAAEVRRPEEVKAAFLFNFAQFVEWPSNAFASAQSPFVIGIVGEDPFGQVLESIVTGETVRGRPLQIRRFRRPRDIIGCHILYLSPSEDRRTAELLAAVRARPILTVGEGDDFIAAGGIMQFVTERSIRLRINLDRAREAGLNISSKLLRLCEIQNK